MQFQPVLKTNSIDARRKWVKSIHRTVNSHDVRALACFDKKASNFKTATGLALFDSLGGLLR
jgi:hypothetical protein